MYLRNEKNPPVRTRNQLIQIQAATCNNKSKLEDFLNKD